MAEALARNLVDSGVVKVEGRVFFASAGVSASDGEPVSGQAIAALERRGIHHVGSARRLEPVMIDRAFAVLGMTQSHAERARRMLAQSGDASSGTVIIETIDKGGDVEDPIGMGPGAYDDVLNRLLELIPSRLSEILRT